MTYRSGGQLGSGLIALLVEDDQNDVILIRRAAERLPLLNRLIALEDGREIMPYLRGVGNYADRSIYPVPEVLLLDHVMPVLSGLEALCQLRAQPCFARLPVLILSGAFTPAQQATVAQLDAVSVVKPCTFQEMQQAIEQGIYAALRIVNRHSSLAAGGSHQQTGGSCLPGWPKQKLTSPQRRQASA